MPDRNRVAGAVGTATTGSVLKEISVIGSMVWQNHAEAPEPASRTRPRQITWKLELSTQFLGGTCRVPQNVVEVNAGAVGQLQCRVGMVTSCQKVFKHLKSSIHPDGIREHKLNNKGATDSMQGSHAMLAAPRGVACARTAIRPAPSLIRNSNCQLNVQILRTSCLALIWQTDTYQRYSRHLEQRVAWVGS